MDKDRREVIKLGIFIVIALIVLVWLVVLTLRAKTYTTKPPKAKRVMQKATPAVEKPVIKAEKYDIEEIRRKQMDSLKQEAASRGKKYSGKQGKSTPSKFNIHPSKEDIKKMESSHAVLY